ncbi:hypothetical protein PRIPAC_88047 [Pristionchus pacificus]|uniref:Uncharacterized protein n=1 Tax=Pristionchus pacificus TaxID=54126 RepID=A0A2A6CX05_PRIPA|nr:hypothetical protein PRIPAC_88047 [Pristionchus pacificus]|eukprot:PDM82563.1 hypothetical protein PRIPAC_36956 [Pristionchus pacificus]
MLLTYFLFLLVFPLTHAYNATLYSLAYLQGERMSFINTFCMNIPKEFLHYHGGVSSLAMPHGDCVALYDHENCGGLHMLLRPGVPWHDDLSEIAFENVARSLGPCDGIYVCPAERVEIERGTHCVGTVISIALIICAITSTVNAIMFMVSWQERKEAQKCLLLNTPLPMLPARLENDYETTFMDEPRMDRS